MTRAGEHIKGLCPSDFPSCIGEQRRIPSQCGGIAGHVYDPTGIQSYQRLNHLGRASLAGRIDYDAVEAQAFYFCRGTVPAPEMDVSRRGLVIASLATFSALSLPLAEATHIWE